MTKSLTTARNLIDGYHELWFQDACKIADKVDAVVKAPRTCQKQTLRRNVPADSPKVYYKLNVAVPFLDHLLQEIKSRFTDKNRVAFKGISLIPSIFRGQYKKSFPLGTKRHHQKAFPEGKICRNEDITVPIGHDNSSGIEEKWLPDLDEIRHEDQGLQIQCLDKQWKRDFLDFCKQYKNDLPSPSTVSHEVDN